MGCNSPGATHHLACDCREREWAERLAGADRALFAERERVVRAELRAASLSQELLAAEKAREEADAYAGRANARIADLGELLDATEAVLRDAESRAEKAERERDAYRHEWNVSSRQQGAETRARYAAESRAARLEEKVRRIQSACGLPDPAEACRVILAIAAEEGK